jgi:hypothetical protein
MVNQVTSHKVQGAETRWTLRYCTGGQAMGDGPSATTPEDRRWETPICHSQFTISRYPILFLNIELQAVLVR